jgi:hypothetical protein
VHQSCLTISVSIGPLQASVVLKNIVLLVVAVALCLIIAPGGCFKESITMSGALIHRLTSEMLFKGTAILILLDKRFALIKSGNMKWSYASLIFNSLSHMAFVFNTLWSPDYRARKIYKKKD